LLTKPTQSLLFTFVVVMNAPGVTGIRSKRSPH
jgi:hypothetical protein